MDKEMNRQEILTAHTAALVEEERHLLQRLSSLLSELDVDAEAREAVAQALSDLSDLFLLVVVGEFNAGKSAVINALLGEPVLKEGVTPTTAHIHIIRHGQTHAETTTPQGVVIVTHPAPWLRHMAVVDTPGTNAVIQRHQEITERFVPRSDLVLFVTSADRPFTESERAFLERIRTWGKKVVFVVNKADLLSVEERGEVRRFITDHARRTLDIEPLVFIVSARLAQQAQQTPSAAAASLWEESGFEALHTFIHRTLDQRERLVLKLSSPLGIARRVLAQAEDLLRARQELLRQDVESIDHIEGQLRAYEEDMRQQFTYHLSKVDNILYEMGARGNRFFDETIRLGRIFDLLNNERLKRQFEQQVIADTPYQVEQQVSALIDWMVDQEFRQWAALTRQVEERAHHHARAVLPTAAAEGFEAKRQQLLRSIGAMAREVVAGYDKEAEVQALVRDVQNTLAHTALVEVGAVGLGAILVAILHGVLLDITGFLGAGVLAAAGLYLLPARREKARKELAARIDQLRADLRRELENAFEQELTRSLERMRGALAPYTRFVRSEQERVSALTAEAEALRQQIAHLEDEVNRL